jgi:hypothetical protein
LEAERNAAIRERDELRAELATARAEGFRDGLERAAEVVRTFDARGDRDYGCRWGSREDVVAAIRSLALDELAAVDADIAAGQEPLGREFEAAWDENREELYESDAGTISKEGT